MPRSDMAPGGTVAPAKVLRAIWSRQPHPGWAFRAVKAAGIWKQEPPLRYDGGPVVVSYDEGTTDAYFLPALFSAPHHTSDNALPSRWAWAELDHERGFNGRIPRGLEPTLVWRTSPGNYHALWSFDRPQSRFAIEGLNRRLAACLSGDASGCDIQQALRIPGTLNAKRTKPFRVKLLPTNRRTYHFHDLCALLPDVPVASATTATPALPTVLPRLQDVRKRLPAPLRATLRSEPLPGDDRSGWLWHLYGELYAAGLTPEHAFVALRDMPWNKWPNQPQRLWADLCRAWNAHAQSKRAGAESIAPRVHCSRARNGENGHA